MRKDTAFETGPKGLGEFQFVEEGLVQVVNEAGIIYQITPDKVLTPLPEMAVGDRLQQVYFRLNSDEDTLYDLRPFGDPIAPPWFIARYKRAPHKEGEAPTHYFKDERTVNYVDERGKPRSFVDPACEQFNVMAEIISGPFKNCEVKIHLGYFYFEDTQEGGTRWRGKGSIGTFTDAFLTQAGFDWNNDTIPFSDNVVPQVDEILTARAPVHAFKIKIKKGWVKEVQPVEEGYLDYLLSQEEETKETEE